MTETVITEVPCGDGDVIRITREIKAQGSLRVHVREWFKDASHEWRPGKKGITIQQKQINAIVAGLLNAGNERWRR